MTRRTISNIPTGMEAWNVYVLDLVAHFPARMPALLAYQRIICDASQHFEPRHWLLYNTRFRACAAGDQSLRWDVKHGDLWLECFTRSAREPGQQPSKNTFGRRPCIPTAVAFSISQTPVPPTPFVPLDTIGLRFPLSPINYPLPAAAPLNPSQAVPIPHHHPQTLKGSAGTSTVVGDANATAVSSPMCAPDVAIRHTGCGRGVGLPLALLPIDQHQLVSPLRPLELERELSHHPNKGFVRQLIKDIRHGCNIGYDGPHFAHTVRHLPTASANAHIIPEALAKECAAGRMAGPFAFPPLPNLRWSGLGVVPKKDGGWRIIYHLSAPPGRSVNEFIDPDQFSLRYCTTDSATAILNALGRHSLMGKIDLKSAFRQLPVRREDWHLLGSTGRAVGTSTSASLWSAVIPSSFSIALPQQFNGSCDNYGIQHLIHYLDDFFTAGPAGSPVCFQKMAKMNEVCKSVNAPIKAEKEEGPFTSLTFLGILLDTTSMQASITVERKTELLKAIEDLRGKRTYTKRRLLSIIGKLAFACKVVPPGRIFLRRLIDLSTTVGSLHHHITFTQEARADFAWWTHFFPNWSGTSLFLDTEWLPSPDMELYTDATNAGYGAYWAGKWFNAAWPSHQAHHTIAWKELYTILAACSTWGDQWARRRVLFHCDNAAVVAGLMQVHTPNVPGPPPVLSGSQGQLPCGHYPHCRRRQLHS